MLDRLLVATLGIAGLAIVWVAVQTVARRRSGGEDRSAACRGCGMEHTCDHYGVRDECETGSEKSEERGAER